MIINALEFHPKSDHGNEKLKNGNIRPLFVLEPKKREYFFAVILCLVSWPLVVEAMKAFFDLHLAMNSLLHVLGIVFLLSVMVPVIVMIVVWPFWMTLKVRCTGTGIELSAFGFVFSRIRWSEITRIRERAWDGFPFSRHYLHKFHIFHKGSFLGFASSLSADSYSQKDLSVFRDLLRKKTKLRVELKTY